MDEGLSFRRGALHFQTIVEESPDVIAVLDRRFRHVFVNDAICAATGLTPADFEGKDHRELGMPEPMVEYFQSVYQRVFDTGEEGAKEFEFPSPDGGMRSYASRVIPLREPDGRIEVVLSYARDVTERKRAEASRLEMERKLQETQRLESLGLLAGGVAHDFNNLLTSIIGSVAIAKAQPHGGSVRAMLDDVESAALRAAELCMQMLAYAGRRQVHKEAVDPSALVRETVHLLTASASKNALVETELPGDLPCVLADRGQAQQVAMNLLLNALEALPDGRGVVKVRARVIEAAERDWSAAIVSPEPASGPLVEIEITDEGIGMDEATLARIFDPFFTTKLVGRGLGLAATLGIVRGHGGGLHVRSRLGEGTTFSLYLRPTSGPRATDEASRGESARSARVLLIDDEPSVRSVIAMMLETAGHRVITSEDGASGVKCFREAPGSVDVALIDMTMPGIDGIETLTRLRESTPHLPAVLMSGYAAEEVSRRLAIDARTHFLQKPFRHPELVAAIDACVAAVGEIGPRAG